ncbi:MAG TPA: acetyl-CoA C-acyltransferase, partial [Ktedonobacterales bacterium]|nr:acetyl-CoA C-acyltransferase [Ktedonobacterales bacterium]
MADSDAVIVAATRTPTGRFLGGLSSLAATDLGGIVIREAIRRAGAPVERIDEVLMGNVVQAGAGQAPARQAALKGGVPGDVSAVTINMVCGSGMRAVMLATQAIKAGDGELFVAGGMESMSNAPYLLLKGRQGYRYGHSTVYDHMALDGLEDAYQKGTAMGVFAEDCASKYHFTREEQDAFSLESLKRARAANEDGSFEWEM